MPLFRSNLSLNLLAFIDVASFRFLDFLPKELFLERGFLVLSVLRAGALMLSRTISDELAPNRFSDHMSSLIRASLTGSLSSRFMALFFMNSL